MDTAVSHKEGEGASFSCSGECVEWEVTVFNVKDKYVSWYSSPISALRMQGMGLKQKCEGLCEYVVNEMFEENMLCDVGWLNMKW